MSTKTQYRQDDGIVIDIERDDSGSVESSATFHDADGQESKLFLAWSSEKGRNLTDTEITDHLLNGVRKYKDRKVSGTNSVRRIELPLGINLTLGRIENEELDEASLRVGPLSVSSKIENDGDETTVRAPSVKWDRKDGALFGFGYKKAFFARFSRSERNEK